MGISWMEIFARSGCVAAVVGVDVSESWIVVDITISVAASYATVTSVPRFYVVG